MGGFAATSFTLGIVAMVVHLLLMLALRVSLDGNGALHRQLFTDAVFRKYTASAPHLRAKYFFPWVPSPELLAGQSIRVRALFWGTRYAATLFVLGFAGFLASVVLAVIGGPP